MTARIGVVTFPGSLDDRDAARAITLAGATPVRLWHDDGDLQGVDAVVLPGGFSYGDYLRCGAIARFSPVMGAVVAAVPAGLAVLGICNGFQVLCEAHLLPGALVRNAGLRFVCRDQRLRVERTSTVWTSAFGAEPDATAREVVTASGGTAPEITVPVKHGEGRFVADPATLADLEREGRVVFRYVGNPNGSAHDIAGICDPTGRVVGLMPHPEHAVDPLTGAGTDGLGVFASLVRSLVPA